MLFYPVKDFLKKRHNMGEYYGLFSELTEHSVLCDYAQSKGFFEAPASTRYHGAYKHGLAIHSLGVLAHACTLLEPFEISLQNREQECDMAIAVLFHDLCKAGAYVEGKRWTKDEAGKWIEVPTYEWNKEYISIGHGTESLRRIEQHHRFQDEAWAYAVAHHMGAFDNADQRTYMSAAEKYREVLLLHTADMMESTFQTEGGI